MKRIMSEECRPDPFSFPVSDKFSWRITGEEKPEA
jgi:hypothetical protein